MGKRKPKPPGTCIFCGRTGLSKEHIWSDWLKELIPRNTTHGEWSEGFEYDFEEKKFTGMRPLMEMTRQGCMTHCKIRNVCEAHCNNGWMGRAVEAAKPIASNLITGQMCKVDEGGVRSLATWLAITTVMQEFTVTRTVMIPPEDRAGTYALQCTARTLEYVDWILWWRRLDADGPLACPCDAIEASVRK